MRSFLGRPYSALVGTHGSRAGLAWRASSEPSSSGPSIGSPLSSCACDSCSSSPQGTSAGHTSCTIPRGRETVCPPLDTRVTDVTACSLPSSLAPAMICPSMRDRPSPLPAEWSYGDASFRSPSSCQVKASSPALPLSSPCRRRLASWRGHEVRPQDEVVLLSVRRRIRRQERSCVLCCRSFLLMRGARHLPPLTTVAFTKRAPLEFVSPPWFTASPIASSASHPDSSLS